MKVLLLGAGGQLGREIALHPDFLQHHQMTALSHSQLNIASLDEVLHAYHHYQPEVVINAAAYTKVDQAEKDPDLAYAVNTTGAGNLAEACEKFDIPLLHFSTDYVFNGEKTGAYLEEDQASPINIYGDSKWQGEELVRQRCSKQVIVRTSWVFGAYGQNFVKTILRLAQERTELKIVADQQGCPTSTIDIAQASFAIIQKIEQGASVWGTYHFCGTPAVSWYEFAEAIINIASRVEPLKLEALLPITTPEYPTPAKRPQNSVLSCHKIITTLGVQPTPWVEALPNIIKGYFHEKLLT